jgi:hypothetical protein
LHVLAEIFSDGLAFGDFMKALVDVHHDCGLTMIGPVIMVLAFRGRVLALRLGSR